MKERMTRVQIRMPKPLKLEAQAKAREEGRDFSTVVRSLLAIWVAKP